MRRRIARLGWIALVIAGLPVPATGRAQDSLPVWVDVFLEQDTEQGTASIYFVDAISGLSTVVRVDNGQRFTLVEDYVLYEKRQSGAIMRASMNGILEPHPFIRREVGTRSVRWVVSQDRAAIAWVVVSGSGVSETFVAWADGRDLRQLPISTPAAGFELGPLALANGMTRFFYDAARPTGTVDVPYATFNHVAQYNIAEETFATLSAEPLCPCGAALTGDGRILARLEADQGTGPFALHVWDLPTEAGAVVPAPDFPYRLAGDLRLNSTGTLAVYGVAGGVGPEGNLLQEQYALVLVDIVSRQQHIALPPGPVRYRPLSFIDDDQGLLLIGTNDGATYKLNLSTRDLQRVSDLTYLGTIQRP